MNLTFSYIILIAIIIILFIVKRNVPTLKGMVGENRINNLLNQLGKDKFVYHDLYIRKSDNTTTQIDHILLSKYGIFVIETKNYSGLILGNEKSKKWIQVLHKKKSFFLNPIWQNKGHIKALKEYLEIEDDVYNIIVFSDAVTLKVDNTKEEAFVIQNKQLLSTIKKFNEEKYNLNELMDLKEKLTNLIITDKSIEKSMRKEHIQYVKSKTKKLEENKKTSSQKDINEQISMEKDNDNLKVDSISQLSRTEEKIHASINELISVEENINTSKMESSNELTDVEENSNLSKDEPTNEKVNEESLLCTKCGGQMFLKKGRYGLFYGCSNYPSCKNTQKNNKIILEV